MGTYISGHLCCCTVLVHLTYTYGRRGISRCIPFLDQLLKKPIPLEPQNCRCSADSSIPVFSNDTTDLRRIDHRERPDIMQLLDAFLSARPPCESHVAFRHDAAHDGDTNAQGVSQGIKRKALVFKL